jgi:propionyl-CoA synthetase
VNKLPKTRSGKILRAILKKLVDGVKLSQIQVPTTIEDPAVLEAVE